MSSTLVQSNETYVLVPMSTCKSFNLSQSSSVSLLSFLSTAYNFTLGNGSFGGGGAGGAKGLTGMSVVCTDTQVSQQASAADINRLLYCGYEQARCNGSSIIQVQCGMGVA